MADDSNPIRRRNFLMGAGTAKRRRTLKGGVAEIMRP
jgi:hypothetical protein